MLPLDRKLEAAFKAVGQKATERYIATQMMTDTVDAQYGRRIQRAYRETVEPSRVPRRPPREILREVPYVGVTTEELGVVRELILDVDLYAKLGMPRTSIGTAALGELRGGVYAQLTVHTGALGETDDYSYTFFVERQQLTAAGIQRQQLVRVRLRGCPVLEQAPVWLCDHIELATPSSDGQDDP